MASPTFGDQIVVTVRFRFVRTLVVVVLLLLKMAPTTVRRVAGRSPRQGTASTSGSRRNLGQQSGRRIRARFVLFRAQVDVSQRAVVVARSRHGLRQQVLERRAHLPDLAAVGFVKVERL